MKTIIVINTDKNTFVGKFGDIASAEAAVANVKYNPYFIASEDEIAAFSGPQLTSIYNSLQKPENAVKKFSDLQTAKSRTWKALEQAGNVAIAKVSTSGRRCRYEPTDFIHVLVKECPRRKGSSGGEHWGLYTDGMRVSELMELHESANYGNNHFYWDIEKGYIVVDSDEEARESE